MSIRVNCGCGATVQAYDVFAGGQVKCAACGQMVAVPDPSLSSDKVHFACPHCHTKVVGRTASVGKSSRCPACAKTYTIPKPEPTPVPEPSHADLSQRQRFRLDPKDVALYGEVLHELERKTELPSDDDTVRPPTRPIAASCSDSEDPLPLLSYTLPVHEEVRFSPTRHSHHDQDEHDHDEEVTLPPVSIPCDELRLVDHPAISAATPSEWSIEPLIDAQLRSAGAHDEVKRSGTEPVERHTPASESFSDKGRPNARPVVPLPGDATITGRTLSARQQLGRGLRVPAPVHWSPRSASGSRPSLVFVDGQSAGKFVPLTGRNFLIGRERDCQFRPSCKSISHHHCVLKIDLYSVRIRDLGSRNGTFVNGHRIYHEVILHHSDHVRIGQLKFKVDIPDGLSAGYNAGHSEISLDEFVIR